MGRRNRPTAPCWTGVRGGMSGRMLWFQQHQVWTSLERANTVRAWSSLQAFWNIKPFVRSVCLGMWEQCHSTPANTDTAGLCPVGRVQRYSVLLNNHINRGQTWTLILFDASWKYQIYRAQTGQLSYAKIKEKWNSVFWHRDSQKRNLNRLKLCLVNKQKQLGFCSHHKARSLCNLSLKTSINRWQRRHAAATTAQRRCCCCPPRNSAANSDGCRVSAVRNEG